MNVRQEAARLLGRIIKEQSYAVRVLDNVLGQEGISPRDGALLTELVYGVLRHLSWIDHLLDRFARQGIGSIDPLVLHHLRVAVYQLLFLDRIPARAAIAEAVEAIRIVRGKQVAGFANGLLRNLERAGRSALLVEPEIEEQAKKWSLFYSHPQWLVERYLARWGHEQTKERLENNNKAAPLTLRVNLRWGDRQQLLESLQGLGATVAPTRYAPDGVHLQGGTGGSLATLMQALPGAFLVQDEASQLLGRWLGVHPGETVLDSCAAPGTKTTHLASLEPRAHITAVDLHQRKLSLIAENCQRLQLENVRLVQADATEPLPEKFDRILCDAPCSGLGVLRRRPEIRYRRTPEDLQRLAALQRRLLGNLALSLQPGGVLIYSVCTESTEECEEVVAWFLEGYPDFVVDPGSLEEKAWGELINEKGYLHTMPERHGMDGFFGVRFCRKN